VGSGVAVLVDGRAQRADAALDDLGVTLWLREMLGGSYDRVSAAIELWYEARGAAHPLRSALVAGRVLVLLTVDDLTFGQIAHELGCSKTTVARRVTDLVGVFPPLSELLDARRLHQDQSAVAGVEQPPLDSLAA